MTNLNSYPSSPTTSLARLPTVERTPQNTARIARIVVDALTLQAYRAVAIVLVSTAKETLPTATVSTDRRLNK